MIDFRVVGQAKYIGEWLVKIDGLSSSSTITAPSHSRSPFTHEAMKTLMTA